MLAAHRFQRLQVRAENTPHEAAGLLPLPAAQQAPARRPPESPRQRQDLSNASGYRVKIGKLAADAVHPQMPVEPRMRDSRSTLKPLITLVTMISVATPSAMPTSEKIAMIETKRSPLRARR